MKNHKVLLLGLDGACFDYMDSQIEKGELPTFKRLMDEGVRANLKSTIPPTTIPAWVSMFTGLSEGQLGCFGQQRWKESSQTFEPVSILSWKGKLLWDIVAETKKVGVFRIQTLPRSYPINGFMITDIYSWHGSPYGNTYPADLLNELNGYWIDTETDRAFWNATRIKLAYKNFEKRIKAATYLLDHKEMDLFVMVTRIPDIISHFTTNQRKIHTAYRIIDSGLNTFLNRAKTKDFNVIIVSDHGTGRQISRGFCVNNWLASCGFLAKNNGNSSSVRELSNLLKDRFTEFAKRRDLYNFLRSLHYFVMQKMGKDAYPTLSEGKTIQWERTKAFSYEGGGTNFTGIQILHKRIFPNSAVDSDEYENLRNELCRRLKDLKDPQTGSHMIEKVFLKEQVFHGDQKHLMPDIILKLKDNYQTISSLASSIVVSDRDLVHTERGIFIADGPIFRKGLEIEQMNIVDIAPTVLHILNIPIPEDMCGKVIRALFTDESRLAEERIKYQAPKAIKDHHTILEREKKQIEERLRVLGYLG